MNRQPRPLASRIVHEEEGTVLVLMTLMLVVLMGFAAIAIDGAAAWALKRQDQSGADTSAIAGAMHTAGRSKTDAMSDAEAEIIRITYSTMTPDMTSDEWAAEWAACIDGEKPSAFTETHSSDCISFTDNLSRIRVRTPIIPWHTTFGKVLGFDRIDTDAVAEVSTALTANGGVLPFGMPGGTQTATEVCLKTGANPKNISPCDGPDGGNFGFLDFTHYGNDELGTSTLCHGGGTDTIERNIAVGIDHNLGTSTDPYATPHTELAGCQDGNVNYLPYHVDTETGNMAQVLDDGFVDGTDGLDGRLARGSNRVSVRGNMLDDTPLWDYLNDAGRTLCGWPIADHDTFDTCLADNLSAGVWSGGEIFTTDILRAPRFGWVPLLLEPSLGAGTTTVTIAGFMPIYIQTTFWGCNATGCDLEWDPGQAVSPGPNNKKIEASTAVNIPIGALPQAIRDIAPGNGTQVTYLLSK